MSPRILLSTARRALTQLRHDRRTVAMIVVVPLDASTVAVLPLITATPRLDDDQFELVTVCVLPSL